MIVAIHQPNFFPWLGYFDKIRACDVFVFLDDIAYPKSGKSMGSWTNRVKCLIQCEPKWAACPVVREPGVQQIKDVRIRHGSAWPEKVLRTIELNYKRAPHFSDNWEWVASMLGREAHRLGDYNIANIREIAAKLGVEAKFVRQSELDTIGASTDLLIDVVRKVNGTTYLCGGGASGYQDDAKFAERRIALRHQDFRHPTYSQPVPDFVPGLSVLDAIFNCGVEQVARMLASPVVAGDRTGSADTV